MQIDIALGTQRSYFSCVGSTEPPPRKNKTMSTATAETKSVELTVACAPWTGEAAADHLVKVDFDLAEGPIVRVWDPVAKHYTRQHALTAADEAQIAAKADEA